MCILHDSLVKIGKSQNPEIWKIWKQAKTSGRNLETGIWNLEKGRKFFEDVTDKISELIQDICKSNPDELYK